MGVVVRSNRGTERTTATGLEVGLRRLGNPRYRRLFWKSNSNEPYLRGSVWIYLGDSRSSYGRTGQCVVGAMEEWQIVLVHRGGNTGRPGGHTPRLSLDHQKRLSPSRLHRKDVGRPHGSTFARMDPLSEIRSSRIPTPLSYMFKMHIRDPYYHSSSIRVGNPRTWTQKDEPRCTS